MPPSLQFQSPGSVAPSLTSMLSPMVEGLVWAQPHGIELKANLYLPKGAGLFPAVVYLHGGGWVNGDRKQLRRQAAYFAGRDSPGLPWNIGSPAKRPIPPLSTMRRWRSAGCVRTPRSITWIRGASRQRAVRPEGIWPLCSA